MELIFPQKKNCRMSILAIIFLIPVAILSIYYLSTTLAFLFYEKPKVKTKVGGVSVIVAARNEEKNLKKLLPLIVSQNHDAYEIIVADDQSSDGTYELLYKFRNELDNFHLIRIDHTPVHFSPKKYALTLCVKAAKYDNLLFIDADCVPSSPDWIEEMTSTYQKDTQFVIGFAPFKRGKGFLNLFSRYENFITAINYIGFALLGRPYMGVGRNLSYKKEIFLENKGFGKFQKLMGGDDDLFVNAYAKRKNTMVRLGKKAKTYSSGKKTWKDYFWQKVRHLSVGKYYKKTDKFLLAVINFSRIMFWLTAFPAILSEFTSIWVISGFSLVLVLLLIQFIAFGRTTRERFEWWWLPFLEIVYLFFYIAWAIKVVRTRKITWH